tara:strand:- start:48 stop:488 length:441 start_codon:yes stop_codon:yes gene_type:complete
MSSIVELLPNVWVGDYKDCGNLLSFTECNINSVINCCNREPFVISNISTYDIDFDKHQDTEEIVHKLHKVVDYLQEQLSKNKFILLYSLQNDQKATTIIACYLIKYGKMEPKNVINAICSKKNNEFYPILHFKIPIFTFYKSIDTV